MAMSLQGSYLYLCTQNGFIYGCNVDDAVASFTDTLDLIQRVSNSIRAVDISSNGAFVAFGGEAMDLCIFPVSAYLEMSQSEGHEKAIVGVRFNRDCSLVASIGYDGKCIIWNPKEPQSEAASIVTRIPLKINLAHRSNSPISIDWSPIQHEIIALPDESGIVLFSVTEQKPIKRIQLPTLKGFIRVLCYSPHGNHLAIATQGQVFVYSHSKKALLPRIQEFSGKQILGLSWQDEDSFWVGFDNYSIEMCTVEFASALEFKEPSPKKACLEEEEEDSLERMIDQLASSESEKEEEEMEDTELAPIVQAPSIRIASSFMPNATPFVSNHRILAWNSLGIATVRQDEAKAKIDVEFFEHEKYRPIRFIDSDGISMAAIGQKGVLFASDYFDDSNPSIIKFQFHDSWALNSDWSIALPSASIRLIALTKNYAVAFLDGQSLLFLSLNGIVKSEIAWPSLAVVAMTGFEDELLVFWVNESGAMQSTLLNLSSFTTTCTCTFSLPGAPSLVWIGFSETGIPLAYCEDGKLWGMLNQCFYSWSPLLDANTLKGPKNEFIWPISVTFDNVLLYIPCFSGEKFPNPSQRRRNTLEAKLEPCPSIKLTSTESDVLMLQIARDLHKMPQGLKLEEEKQSFVDSFDYTLDKQLLELILAALNAERQSKAVELVTMLTLEPSYQKAVKLCQHLKLWDLADKIDLLRERTFCPVQKHYSSPPAKEGPFSGGESSQSLFSEASSHQEEETQISLSQNVDNSQPNNATTLAIMKSPMKQLLNSIPVPNSPKLESSTSMKATSTNSSLSNAIIPKKKNPFAF